MNTGAFFLFSVHVGLAKFETESHMCVSVCANEYDTKISRTRSLEHTYEFATNGVGYHPRINERLRMRNKCAISHLLNKY